MFSPLIRAEKAVVVKEKRRVHSRVCPERDAPARARPAGKGQVRRGGGVGGCGGARVCKLKGVIDFRGSPQDQSLRFASGRLPPG